MTRSDNPLKVTQKFFSRPNETNLIHLHLPAQTLSQTGPAPLFSTSSGVVWL